MRIMNRGFMRRTGIISSLIFKPESKSLTLTGQEGCHYVFTRYESNLYKHLS